MKDWLRNTQSLGVVIGLAIWAFLGAYVGYQAVFPLKIAEFHSVAVPNGIYYPGDVIYYSVYSSKFYPAVATVVREVVCESGAKYEILPHLKGVGAVGENVTYLRDFVLPTKVRGPDRCYLASTFSYDNINPYHRPLTYKKDSNYFSVGAR
jgi:hypothetical protein